MMIHTETPVSAGRFTAPTSYIENTNCAEISLARNRMEIVEAFRVLYDSYHRAGLAAENPLKFRMTEFHLLPTTEVLVAKSCGEVVSTLTMVADSDRGLPMDCMYESELRSLRSKGRRLAEIGCLADRRDSSSRFLKTLEAMAQLVVQVAQQRGIDALVVAAHPRHGRFYTRCLGFEEFGGLARCPYVQGNPAVALVLDFNRIRNTPLQHLFFGFPYPPEQLAQSEWHPSTVNFMRTLLELQSTPPEAVGMSV